MTVTFIEVILEDFPHCGNQQARCKTNVEIRLWPFTLPCLCCLLLFYHTLHNNVFPIPGCTNLCYVEERDAPDITWVKNCAAAWPFANPV